MLAMALSFEKAQKKKAIPSAAQSATLGPAKPVLCRHHSYPDAGPSTPKPVDIRRTKSEPSKESLDELLSKETDWQCKWRALHSEGQSPIPHPNGNLIDDPMPEIKGKGKDNEGPEDAQDQRKGSNDAQQETEGASANPTSSALIAEILKGGGGHCGHYGHYHPKTGERIVEDAGRCFANFSWSNERLRPLPTPPASPCTRAADSSQSSAIELLETIRGQTERHMDAIHAQHRKKGLLVCLRAPHRQVERCMKKLLNALYELCKALKETIASCLIIDRISGLSHDVGAILTEGNEDDMVEKARISRKAARELVRELNRRGAS